MRKIIADLAITLDGFIEGAAGETDWCIMDEEMDFSGFLNGIDAIFYGRKSYVQWGQYRPAADAPDSEKQFWQAIHAKEKYVFSSKNRSDEQVTCITGNIAAGVKELKTLAGKDIWLYGGAKLIGTFISLNLVDEYRLSVHPVALGQGKALFADLQHRLDLRLMNSRVFASGVVQLVYGPAE